MEAIEREITLNERYLKKARRQMGLEERKCKKRSKEIRRPGSRNYVSRKQRILEEMDGNAWIKGRKVMRSTVKEINKRLQRNKGKVRK